MGLSRSQSGGMVPQAAALVLAALLLLTSCSDEGNTPRGDAPPDGKTKIAQETNPSTGPETTGGEEPPEVTLREDPGGQPDVMIRLEGDPGTTFSGLCSVGEGQNVLSGQVPKRFAFDLKGRPLSCRIEKQDGGELKVVLVAGDTTRSVQQTNAPGGIIKLVYGGS